MSKLLFVFESTHTAISSQTALKEFNITVMPTPQEITSGCGISVMLSDERIVQAITALENIGITSGDYRLYSVNENKDEKYTQVNYDER